jgi:hypothetical protein
MLNEILNADPEELDELVKLLEVVIDRGLNIATTVLKQIAEDDDFFKSLAKTTKKMFDELLAVGFSEEQALKILCSFSPSASKK